MRAFSSWAVSRLGGGGVSFVVSGGFVVEVVWVVVEAVVEVMMLGSSGIWTLILRMYSSS